jgi:hypothetical protein
MADASRIEFDDRTATAATVAIDMDDVRHPFEIAEFVLDTARRRPTVHMRRR